VDVASSRRRRKVVISIQRRRDEEFEVAIEGDAGFVEEERAVSAPKRSTLSAFRKLIRKAERLRKPIEQRSRSQS
jgi:hypothetical protein